MLIFFSYFGVGLLVASVGYALSLKKLIQEDDVVVVAVAWPLWLGIGAFVAPLWLWFRFVKDYCGPKNNAKPHR